MQSMEQSGMALKWVPQENTLLDMLRQIGKEMATEEPKDRRGEERRGKEGIKEASEETRKTWMYVCMYVC